MLINIYYILILYISIPFPRRSCSMNYKFFIPSWKTSKTGCFYFLYPVCKIRKVILSLVVFDGFISFAA